MYCVVWPILFYRLRLDINFKIERIRCVEEIDRFALPGEVSYPSCGQLVKAYWMLECSQRYFTNFSKTHDTWEGVANLLIVWARLPRLIFKILLSSIMNAHIWTSQWFNSHCIFKVIHTSHFGLVIPYTAYSHPALLISPIYVFFFPLLYILQIVNT